MCASATLACQGCDTDQPTRRYSVLFTGATAREAVDYCEDCATLAAINWNGCTESIEPEPAA